MNIEDIKITGPDGQPADMPHTLQLLKLRATYGDFPSVRWLAMLSIDELNDFASRCQDATGDPTHLADVFGVMTGLKAIDDNVITFTTTYEELWEWLQVLAVAVTLESMVRLGHVRVSCDNTSIWGDGKLTIHVLSSKEELLAAALMTEEDLRALNNATLH